MADLSDITTAIGEGYTTLFGDRPALTNVHPRESQINNQLGPTGRFQINQALEKRAGLRFNYAYSPWEAVRPEGRHGTDSRRWLPFYEDPQIVESRKANYAETDIFLRNEPVRLYTGADARKFKLDIHYSIYHMMMMCPTDLMLQYFTGRRDSFVSEMQAIREFVNHVAQEDCPSVQTDRGSLRSAQAAIAQMHDRALDGSMGPVGPIPSNPDSRFNAFLTYTMGVTQGYQKIFSLLQYMLNHVRNTVIGSQSMPVKGPPIVELKYGLMYNFVPCIVTDYRIQAIQEAGTDPKSLYSQRFKISLSLEEFRNYHGNLWGVSKESEPLPGWDTVLKIGNLDVPEDYPDQVASPTTGFQTIREYYQNRVQGPPPAPPGGYFPNGRGTDDFIRGIG